MISTVKYTFNTGREVFRIRYKIKTDPDSKQPMRCIVYGHVSAEYTNCNEDLIVILNMTNHSTVVGCRKWADKCRVELNKWYTRQKLRGFLVKNLKKETLEFLEREIKYQTN